MQNMETGKRAVEELLKCRITEEQFLEALEYAKKKQDYIYRTTGRNVVLQPWYLARLTMEYVRNLAFSKMTMELCEKLDNMKKEHQIKKSSTPTSNSIISIFEK